ncbi:hypothetical protein [Gracilibacillus alcaliphilus]|uniref:hypothetical protein n=1 Tax=Gracilibacillus alcaliphilus TaxID=1401441 RepID=UPI00195A9264|nr:hypothetical protein [Gracilibacillus alcaliphilus]MBM7676173.1 hypothetical protein [Gracilibacillus alcaliphilus]
MMRNKLIYAALICLITMIGLELGGAIYEGVVVASQWSAHPPASFAILQGSYALPVEHFWIPLHMIVQVLTILVLILCWKYYRVRNLVFVIIGLYLLLRIPTFLYFIPELAVFSTTEPVAAFSKELKERADMWVNLSMIRTMIIASVYVLGWIALSQFKQQEIRNN